MENEVSFCSESNMSWRALGMQFSHTLSSTQALASPVPTEAKETIKKPIFPRKRVFLWAEGLHEASGKLLGVFLSQCYATEQDCNVPRRFRSTLVPLMSELGWHVQINMKYFSTVSQWQQSLSRIYACKMLPCSIREDFCAIQELVTRLL